MVEATVAMRCPIVAPVFAVVAAVAAVVAVTFAHHVVIVLPTDVHRASVAPARSAKPVASNCTFPVRRPSMTSCVPVIESASPMNFCSAAPAPSPRLSKLSLRSRLTLSPALPAADSTSCIASLNSEASPRTTALIVAVLPDIGHLPAAALARRLRGFELDPDGAVGEPASPLQVGLDAEHLQPAGFEHGAQPGLHEPEAVRLVVQREPVPARRAQHHAARAAGPGELGGGDPWGRVMLEHLEAQHDVELPAVDQLVELVGVAGDVDPGAVVEVDTEVGVLEPVEHGARRPVDVVRADVEDLDTGAQVTG